MKTPRWVSRGVTFPQGIRFLNLSDRILTYPARGRQHHLAPDPLLSPLLSPLLEKQRITAAPLPPSKRTVV